MISGTRLIAGNPDVPEFLVPAILNQVQRTLIVDCWAEIAAERGDGLVFVFAEVETPLRRTVLTNRHTGTTFTLPWNAHSAGELSIFNQCDADYSSNEIRSIRPRPSPAMYEAGELSSGVPEN